MGAVEPELIHWAYHKLIRLDSRWAQEVQARLRAIAVEEPMQHLAICFDDGPSYEVLCQDVDVDRIEVVPGPSKADGAE